MADTKVTALTAQTTATGNELMLAVDTGANVSVTPKKLRDYVVSLARPAYISGNWYSTIECATTGNTSTGAFAASTLYFYPFIIYQNVTISQLGIRIATAGTNVKLGIYANNNSTMKPTGTCLGSTANIDVTGTGNKAAALSGGNVSLTPGIYWMAWAGDNTATRALGVTAGMTQFLTIAGTTDQARLIGASSNYHYSMSTSEVYGTFGDMTGATISAGSTAFPHIHFKVA